MSTARLLWLDDCRDPFYNQVKFDGTIFWVKSVEQFSAWIEENGLPDMISFDYVLGNMPDMFTDGIGAAKAVIRYCTKGDEVKEFPQFAVHSEHEDAYKLQQYIHRAIDLYELGEIRQVGKILEKPVVTENSNTRNFGTRSSYTPTQPIVPAKPKYTLGRNDNCGCGSGKKYKRCCINK